MTQNLTQVALLVREYDEAIEFFVGAVGFELREDTRLSETKRWVIVAPLGSHGGALLLARAIGPDQIAAVGKQMAGRVGFFLQTDDFARDYERMRSKGVRFREEPRHESYGTVAVFLDLYGNAWDLIGPKSPNKAPAVDDHGCHGPCGAAGEPNVNCE